MGGIWQKQRGIWHKVAKTPASAKRANKCHKHLKKRELYLFIYFLLDRFGNVCAIFRPFFGFLHLFLGINSRRQNAVYGAV